MHRKSKNLNSTNEGVPPLRAVVFVTSVVCCSTISRFLRFILEGSEAGGTLWRIAD